MSAVYSKNIHSGSAHAGSPAAVHSQPVGCAQPAAVHGGCAQPAQWLCILQKYFSYIHSSAVYIATAITICPIVTC